MSFLFMAFAVAPIVVVLLSNERFIRPTICGVAAAFTAYFVETLIIDDLASKVVGMSEFSKVFFLFAVTEEVLKLAFLSATSALSGPSNRVLLAGALCGLGFGCTENFFYTIGFWQPAAETSQAVALSIMRFILPLAMHVTAGPILALGFLRTDRAPLIGLFAAILFHGAYNAVVISQSALGYTLGISIILGGLIAASLIYKDINDGDVRR